MLHLAETVTDSVGGTFLAPAVTCTTWLLPLPASSGSLKVINERVYIVPPSLSPRLARHNAAPAILLRATKKEPSLFCNEF